MYLIDSSQPFGYLNFLKSGYIAVAGEQGKYEIAIHDKDDRYISALVSRLKQSDPQAMAV